MIYYDPSENAFLDTSFYAYDVPEGAVEITPGDHADLLAGNAAGSTIAPGKGGKPMLVPPPELTATELSINALSKRDSLLTEAALRIAPLQDAVDLEDASETEVDQLKKWKTYRVALNRIQDQPKFPSKITWPKVPA